jgi:long-subunit fatty acid transport protein
VSLFARYDSAKPNKDTIPSLEDTYYNVGVSYAAYKNVDFALVYKHEKVDNGTINTSNGNIGGTNDGTYDEIGVWSQLKF